MESQDNLTQTKKNLQSHQETTSEPDERKDCRDQGNIDLSKKLRENGNTDIISYREHAISRNWKIFRRNWMKLKNNKARWDVYRFRMERIRRKSI